MSDRPLDDFTHERQALDTLHAQNEAQRDTFVGLAHTALLAASISFVGDIAPLGDAIWKPMLLLGWSADVIGLLAITMSFGAARRAIDARRAALNKPEAPSSKRPEILNDIALWSFPAALLCLFSFVTANVVQPMPDKYHTPPLPSYEQKGATPPPRAPSHDGSSHPSTGAVPAPRAPAAPSPAAPPPPTRNDWR